MAVRDIYEIKAEEIATPIRDFFDANDSLSKVLGKIDSDYVLIAEEGKLSGFIRSENLLKHLQDPDHTKIRKIVEDLTIVSEKENLPSLCFKRANGSYVMHCKTGVISDLEIMKALAEFKELENIRASLLAQKLITVEKNDGLDKVRALMVKKKISRVGVIDGNKLIGVLRARDILKLGIHRKRIGKKEFASEKQRLWRIPASEFVDKKLVVFSDEISLRDALKEAVKNNVLEVFFEKKGSLKILTSSDIIKFVANLHFSKFVEIKLIGVDTSEEKLLMHEYIERALKRKLRFLKKPSLFEVHYKKISKTGLKHLYQLDFRLECEYGILNARSEDWNLLTALEKGLKHIERLALEKKERYQK